VVFLLSYSDITLSFHLENNFSICSNYVFNRGITTINLVDEITEQEGTVIENVLPRKCQYFKWFFFGMEGVP
jgi:hypothetical protein